MDNNTALGGGFAGGGGIENSHGLVTITNSTISGNKLTGGVLSRGGGIFNSGTLILRNVTIAFNGDRGKTKHGGGIFNLQNNSVGLVEMSNTLIMRNQAVEGPDCTNTGTIRSQGFNLVEKVEKCDFPKGTGDQAPPESEPRIFGLGYYGGLTQRNLSTRTRQRVLEISVGKRPGSG